jgi:hypothetical protein
LYCSSLTLFSRQGDALFDAGRFDAAEAKYFQEAFEIVGSGLALPTTAGDPTGGVICDLYVGLNLWKRANLMGCCVGIAKCLRRKNDIEMV